MGRQTIRQPERDEQNKDEKPRSEHIPASADVPEDTTSLEPPPEPWPD
jgi:hypothetical protein